MKTRVKKAVFPAAGLGSRFLPATKAMPKEMMPIVDKPVIQYLVEEAVASGIEEIIIVTGRGKRAIEDHFDHSFELSYTLERKGQMELLETVQGLEKMAKFFYVRQPQPLGDGHAILCAKEFIGNEPFAVLFGDDIVDHEVPALKQLLDVFEEKKAGVLAVEKVPQEELDKYGVIDTPDSGGPLFKIQGLVEKPKPEDAPSSYGIIGKYICPPEIFSHLENCQTPGELRLIDGFKSLLQAGHPLFAYQIAGTRYDTGNKWGWLEANLAFAMKDPELRQKLEALKLQ